MATEYSILARLRADASQFVKEVTGAFNTAEARGGKAADGIGAKFAKALSKASGQAAKRGAQGLAGLVGFGIKEAIDFEQVIDDIGIQSGATADEMDAFRASVQDVSAATGLSREAVAKAGESLVNLLGPAGRNAELLDVLARTAVASGADVGELAGLVSAVADSFGIAVDDTEAMEGALSAFLSTGKQGKVPLGEMNSVLQEVASNFAEMGATGRTGAADVSAALQIARTSFGTAAQAGTGLKSGVTALKTHGKEIDKAIRRLAHQDKSLSNLKGFTVWSDKSKTQLKSFRELAPALARLNLEQLTKLMGSSEAAKFWAAFKGEGWDNFKSMADVASNAGDVTKDFAKRQETSGFKLKKSWNDAKLALAQAITPELLERFVGVVERLSKIFIFMADNVTAVVEALLALKMLSMASNFQKTAAGASAAADAIGGMGSSATGAAGAMGKLGAIQQAAAAGFAGFFTGQAIGRAFVGQRKAKFEEAKREQKVAEKAMMSQAEAVQFLLEKSPELISEEGVLEPGFAKELRISKALGRTLTPEQKAADIALGGFETTRAVSVGVSEQLGLSDIGTRAGERKQLIRSEEQAIIPSIQGFTEAVDLLRTEMQASREATADNTRAQRTGSPKGGQGNLGRR